jgi:hypothetical protein
MTVAIYDPSEVDILVGAFPIEGWADGEFLTIEYNEDDYILVVGTDGTFTRSKQMNGSVDATIKIMQSSTANAFLSALRLVGRKTTGGGDIVPFVVKDKNDATQLFFAAQSWIKSFPKQPFDKSATPREWIFTIPDPEVFIGGTQ